MQPQFEPRNNQTLSPTLSGALGLVIIPDRATIEIAYQLAAEALPNNAEYILAPGSLPHLTLYHGKLQGLPAPEATAIVQKLRGALIGHKLSLNQIVGFGGNFVFWNVTQDDAPKLSAAHEKALTLARYLDPASLPKATSEEGLSLSAAQLENVRLYGHPLVRALFNPHITLGFHRGVAQSIRANCSQSAQFSIAAVELVRVGYPGRVESIVALE